MTHDFHAEWESNGFTITVDLDRNTGETDGEFAERCGTAVREKLNEHPADVQGV